MVDGSKEDVKGFRERCYLVIFEHDTPMGKAFDVALLLVILASIVTVMLESVNDIRANFGTGLIILEWFFTIVFTFEYALRIYTARDRWAYLRSPFGIIDLLAILPTYVSLVVAGSQALLTIRAVRLLRVARVLKLVDYLQEASSLGEALKASGRKIVVFLGVVVTLAVIMGSVMYVVEGTENGFTSIPRSVYWAIVTMTTVGYGDIAPQTVLGQVIAASVMILGYSIIAVPTGIVSAELVHGRDRRKACGSCSADQHDRDAKFCKHCGESL